MQVQNISVSSNPNFGKISKVRIPMKDGTTKLLEVTGEVNSYNGTIEITDIVGKIMHKGKEIGKKFEYHCENRPEKTGVSTIIKNLFKDKGCKIDFEPEYGFRDEELAVIGEEIAQGSREPYTVISKIFNSIAEPNIDLNA